MVSKPTKKLTQFMKAVQTRNIMRLYSHCQLTWKKNNSKNRLAFYQQIKVSNFEIKESEFTNGTGTAIKARVEYDYRALESKSKVKRMYSIVMLICEKEPYTPDVKGKWGVNPISFMKMKEVDVQQPKS
jgi:hypothetical protein